MTCTHPAHHVMGTGTGVTCLLCGKHFTPEAEFTACTLRHLCAWVSP